QLQALRYAKLSALKLCSALEAAHIDGQLPDDAYALGRQQLARLFAQLSIALPSDEGAPARSEAESSQVAIASVSAAKDEPDSDDALGVTDGTSRQASLQPGAVDDPSEHRWAAGWRCSCPTR